jgi:dynein heavy chain, axonemal
MREALSLHSTQDLLSHLSGLFEWLAPVSLRWMRRETKEACPTLDASLIVTAIRLFSSLTPHFAVGRTDGRTILL